MQLFNVTCRLPIWESGDEVLAWSMRDAMGKIEQRASPKADVDGYGSHVRGRSDVEGNPGQNTP